VNTDIVAEDDKDVTPPSHLRWPDPKEFRSWWRFEQFQLRWSSQRPYGRRAAEQRDELAPPDHSITSSARASTDGGKVETECLRGLEV
jgi:hypothetical protein